MVKNTQLTVIIFLWLHKKKKKNRTQIFQVNFINSSFKNEASTGCYTKITILVSNDIMYFITLFLCIYKTLNKQNYFYFITVIILFNY